MTDQVLEHEETSDYMARRYEEALAKMTEELKQTGQEISAYLRIYLVTFYHHGVSTGINSLHHNNKKAGE